MAGRKESLIFESMGIHMVKKQEPFKFENMGTGLGLPTDFIISGLIWTLLQVFFMKWPDLRAYKIEKKTYLDLRNRMVSFVHGLLALILTAN